MNNTKPSTEGRICDWADIQSRKPSLAIQFLRCFLQDALLAVEVLLRLRHRYATIAGWRRHT